ncbi:MAG: hypothetical protein KJS97_10675 [Alphaproteobacteria bacterium]|nr:hypothetical protein [Alphaproteobacteria bacterium]
MSEYQIEEAPCPLADLAEAREAEASRPPRRKRVAFALWFGGLIAAGAVIAMGAAPLLTP